jgi:hypothetical protein
MAEKWHVGNANTDGERTRGWLLGHFIGEGDDPEPPRPSRSNGAFTRRGRAATAGRLMSNERRC